MVARALDSKTYHCKIFVDFTVKDLGPGPPSFLKVKKTVTFREVILRHDN